MKTRWEAIELMKEFGEAAFLQNPPILYPALSWLAEPACGLNPMLFTTNRFWNIQNFCSGDTKGNCAKSKID